MESGQILALTGSNGCGKTSLLRIMAGLLKPAIGNMRWNDKVTDTEFASKNILWMGQETPLKPHLSVAENLSFLSGIMDTKDGTDKEVKKAIAKTGLQAFSDYPVQYLSMGQRRRALLALLFLMKRKIWLIDEPTNHLDKEGREHLVTGVENYIGQGGIAVIATHRPEIWQNCKTLDVSSFKRTPSTIKDIRKAA